MMKKIYSAIVIGVLTLPAAAQTVILQENFNVYMGTAATVPPGWTFTYNGNYTSAVNSGPSGPNSYKFGANAASIETPVFSNADSVHFWMKGVATDAASSLDVMESADNVNWSTISTLVPLPTTGTLVNLHVQPSTTYLKFVYNKSAGNLAFDDFSLTGSSPSTSTGKIIVYFNRPVNTSVSTGVNAIYLNQSSDDTLIAYINRAKFSLDIAVYNYIQTSPISNIATAINNAYNRGVKIRWIYNGSSSNSGLSQLNAGINKLASPTSSSYNIMHNKFMVIDAHSANAADPIVWTGSMNWDAEQMNSDVNNIVILQDKNLALAYTTEFNEMWGDTGLVPNLSNSKFGPFKTDNTPHTFTIGGHLVESYFSPSDGTNNHIRSTIHSADDDLFFGVYTFTDASDADSIKVRIQQHGVYAAGIMDQYSTTFTPYSTLNPLMGNMLQIYTQNTSLYHNKFLIVDPCSNFSDPAVLTGSHNWTSSANTQNDENTLIIHDDTIANIYFQSFDQNFLDLGGSISNPCTVTAVQQLKNENALLVFPDPANDHLFVNTDLSGDVTVSVYDITGREVISEMQDALSLVSIDVSTLPAGLYFVRVSNAGNSVSQKVFIRHF